jgi:hypothetical protein
VESCVAIPSNLLREGGTELCSALCALLDAQLIFRESGLSLEQFEPLWDLYYRDCPLDGPIQSLCRMELVQISPASICAVSSDLCLTLAEEIDGFLTKQTICLPQGDLTVGKLLDDFLDYYCTGPAVDLPAERKPEKVCGGIGLFSSNRAHYVLIRPYSPLLRAHEESFILLVCSLPEAVTEVIADSFVKSPALRHRVALFDPERGLKFNLTKSEVFVHFERFLRRVYGVRSRPDPMLTQSLLDAGLLSFDKG